MIRNGNVELQAREEEIRFLKMQLNEEKRSITVLHSQMPNKSNLEQEQLTLQIQVRECVTHFLVFFFHVSALKDQGHLVLPVTVCLSVCMSVHPKLSVKT